MAQQRIRIKPQRRRNGGKGEPDDFTYTRSDTSDRVTTKATETLRRLNDLIPAPRKEAS